MTGFHRATGQGYGKYVAGEGAIGKSFPNQQQQSRRHRTFTRNPAVAGMGRPFRDVELTVSIGLTEVTEV